MINEMFLLVWHLKASWPKKGLKWTNLQWWYVDIFAKNRWLMQSTINLVYKMRL